MFQWLASALTLVLTASESIKLRKITRESVSLTAANQRMDLAKWEIRTQRTGQETIRYDDGWLHIRASLQNWTMIVSQRVKTSNWEKSIRHYVEKLDKLKNITRNILEVLLITTSDRSAFTWGWRKGCDVQQTSRYDVSTDDMTFDSTICWIHLQKQIKSIKANKSDGAGSFGPILNNVALFV